MVSRCRFSDISGSAIQIGDVRAEDHHPADPRLVVRENSVLGCDIHDCGAEYEGSVGIFVGYAQATTIAHNDIWNLPYSGISLGWGWGEEDAGGGAYAIPYRYETPTPAGAIRWNHIHDNGPGGPGGIYLDEGSGFLEVTGNIVYRVGRAMNYNNLAQDRISTCFEHENFFDVEPGAPEFPAEVAARAGRAGAED